MYEIKYKESPNNLIVVKIKLKTEIIIYVNIKRKSAWQNVLLKIQSLGRLRYHNNMIIIYI